MTQTWNLSKKFTPPDFWAKNFTPSISPNFNSFSGKNTKNEWKWRNLHRWQKFYTATGSDGIDKFHLCSLIQWNIKQHVHYASYRCAGVWAVICLSINRCSSFQPKNLIIFRVFSEWLIPEPGESYMPQIPSAPLPAPNSANKSDQVTDRAMDVGFKKQKHSYCRQQSSTI